MSSSPGREAVGAVMLGGAASEPGIGVRPSRRSRWTPIPGSEVARGPDSRSDWFGAESGGRFGGGLRCSLDRHGCRGENCAEAGCGSVVAERPGRMPVPREAGCRLDAVVMRSGAGRSGRSGGERGTSGPERRADGPAERSTAEGERRGHRPGGPAAEASSAPRARDERRGGRRSPERRGRRADARWIKDDYGFSRAVRI